MIVTKRIKSATPINLAAAVIALGGSLHAEPLIYEPFDGEPGPLSGQTAGTGLTDTWSATAIDVTSGSLSFGSLPTSGNSAAKSSGNFQRGWAEIGTTLSDADLLDDGATLWFSALAVADSSDGDTRRTYISIGNGYADGFDRIGTHEEGKGFAIKLNNGTILAHGWRGPGAAGGAAVAIPNGTHLLVGKITWAASGSDDTLEVFLPGTDLALPAAAVSTLSYDFDQSAFTTISFAGGSAGTVPEVDEIRFAASYEEVIGGDGPAAPAFAITEITHSPDTDMLTLTWTSKPGEQYAVKFSGDMSNWESDLDDGIDASEGETTTETFDLSDADLQDAGRVLFRVEKQ